MLKATNLQGSEAPELLFVSVEFGDTALQHEDLLFTYQEALQTLSFRVFMEVPICRCD
jgi:hypothetical protein